MRIRRIEFTIPQIRLLFKGEGEIEVFGLKRRERAVNGQILKRGKIG